MFSAKWFHNDISAELSCSSDFIGTSEAPHHLCSFICLLFYFRKLPKKKTAFQTIPGTEPIHDRSTVGLESVHEYVD